MKRKAWIIIAAAVLLAGVVVFLFLRPIGGTELLSSESFPYRCTLKQQRKGLLITVEGEFPEGYTWRTTSESYTSLKTERRKDEPDKVSYFVEPTETGPDEIHLLLTNQKNTADNKAALYYSFLTDSRGKILLLSFREEIPRGQVFFGEETEYPFSVSFGYADTMTVALPKTQKGRWEACSWNKKLLMLELGGETGTQYCALRAKRALFDTSVYLYNEEEGRALALNIQADALGRLSPESFESEPLLTKQAAREMLEALGYTGAPLEAIYGAPFLRTLLSTKGGAGIRARLLEDGYYEEDFLIEEIKRRQEEQMEEILRYEEESRAAEEAARETAGDAQSTEPSTPAVGDLG